MIPLTEEKVHISDTWQAEIKQMIRTPEALIAAVGLDEQWLEPARKAAKLFPIRVTPSFVNKMAKGDVNDPLLRQVLPLAQELENKTDFVNDPLQEQNFNVKKGVLHKYNNRVLTITTSACAIHCRYCFRRHFPYQENSQSRQDWQKSLAYLAEQPQVDELILSGGDPLMLTNKALEGLMKTISEYPQIKRIRFHTRMPIVTPSRIDKDLLTLLGNQKQTVIFVVHSNHANEICNNVKLGAELLKSNNVRLFNQAVLMRGVNDSVDALLTLNEALFEIGIQPYYLHLMDKVAGAHHFDVPEDEAVRLYNQLRAQTSGYLVPQLAREVAGDSSKRVIASSG